MHNLLKNIFEKIIFHNFIRSNYLQNPHVFAQYLSNGYSSGRFHWQKSNNTSQFGQSLYVSLQLGVSKTD